MEEDSAVTEMWCVFGIYSALYPPCFWVCMPLNRKSEETIFFRKQKLIWAQEQQYNNASLIFLTFVEGNPTWYLFSIGFYGTISYHSSALSNFKRIPIGWHNVMNVSIKIFGATHVQLCTTCMSLHSRLQAGDLKKKP